MGRGKLAMEKGRPRTHTHDYLWSRVSSSLDYLGSRVSSLLDYLGSRVSSSLRTDALWCCHLYDDVSRELLSDIDIRFRAGCGGQE